MARNLLRTPEYRARLEIALSNAEKTASVISAYVTNQASKWIIDRLPDSVSGRVITRWRLDDLLCGASDLNVYETLAEVGHELYVRPDLHGKSILIDNRDLFVGSANITLSGLGLLAGGNFEIGAQLVATENDILIVDELFESSVLIDSVKFEMIKDAYNSIVGNEPNSYILPIWPKTVCDLLRPSFDKLWVAELLWSPSPSVFDDFAANSQKGLHDLNLLGISVEQSRSSELLAAAFEGTRAWRWLKNQLKSSPVHAMYFGQLSSALHDALVDDPRPFRTDVKLLTSNLIAWAAAIRPDDVVVDRPNYSQRIRLIL